MTGIPFGGEYDIVEQAADVTRRAGAWYLKALLCACQHTDDEHSDFRRCRRCTCIRFERSR